MLPGKLPVDLETWSGNHAYWRFIMQDANADPIDLTGVIIRCFIGPSKDALLFRFVSGDANLTIPTPASGVVELFMTVPQVRTLVAGSNKIEFEQYESATVQQSLLYGNIKHTVYINDDNA